ncbi:SixA phosphatase family protein [Spirosoma validum]|uniref:Histidine phosphatase family protein n=1 Tax=Spirosoma validum TaxID=2771355 RepID=A0A927B0C5_9BACT|nr:phosphoglycerate mutase family protein [Spirosoma validum]MBD2753215.1 histidine phosphatase family protein [Spirosoma validum]
MRLFFLIVIGITFLTGCSTTTVYIVRHGEKVSEADTTDLNAAGKQRAIALADTLVNKGIDSIFTTPYRRTRQTAEPLAQRINVRMVEYPAKPNDAIVNRVGQIRGKTVLVVGHSNTILDIAKGLGAQPTLAKIESGDFDNLLRVRIRRGLFGKSVSLSQTTYGQPTQP